MRDNVVMGPATVSTSVTIPRQTDTATDLSFSLHQGNSLCVDSELPTIQQGSTDESRQ